VAEHSSTEEIPDKRARRLIRETPDKNKGDRCLSDRFRSIRRALAKLRRVRGLQSAAKRTKRLLVASSEGPASIYLTVVGRAAA
jgi:hypothetical protein